MKKCKKIKQVLNRLRRYRKIKGYNITKARKKLGMKNGTRLSQWERGIIVPSLKNALKLSHLYGVDTDELFNEMGQVAEAEMVEARNELAKEQEL